MALVEDFGKRLLRNADSSGRAKLNGILILSDELFQTWVRSKHFRQVLASPFRRREHINLLELHAHRPGR